jgi:enoyl-CoA hydratase/carnithine racemase
MDYEQILYDLDDGVVTLTLNRPDKLNAYTRVMMNEMLDALDRADADDDVRAVIVTGAGRGFCAGADLSGEHGRPFGGQLDDDVERGDERMRDSGGRLSLRIHQSLKPLIAAVNGPAVGIGATMTLPMDIRLIADGARMGFVFARRGIVPEAASTWFLPRLVGPGKALEWMLSGRLIAADEALAGGLVHAVHTADDLLPAARAIAREIADNTSAVSVALIRQMIWSLLGADHPMEAHRLESWGIHAMGRAPDAQEGVASFFEKRPPRFTMKPSTDMPDYYPWAKPRSFA